MVLLVAFISLISAELTYGIMNSVPVVRTSWEPRSQIDASYAKLLDDDTQGFAGTDFTFMTSRPTIRLANFLQITHIGCTPDQLALVFDKKESADSAIKAWNSTNDFTVIVPHEAQCNGDKAISLAVHGMEQKDNNVLMKIEHLEFDKVIKEWNVVVNQYQVDPTRAKRDTGKKIKEAFNKAGDNLKKIGNTIAKAFRNLGEDLKKVGEKIAKPFRFHLDKSKKLKMDINYDAEKNTAKNRNMTIFDTRVIWPHPLRCIVLIATHTVWLICKSISRAHLLSLPNTK